MAFMLGSLTDGMFRGAQSVMSLYGMYQEGQIRQAGIDAGKKVLDAQSDPNNSQPSPYVPVEGGVARNQDGSVYGSADMLPPTRVAGNDGGATSPTSTTSTSNGSVFGGYGTSGGGGTSTPAPTAPARIQGFGGSIADASKGQPAPTQVAMATPPVSSPYGGAPPTSYRTPGEMYGTAPPTSNLTPEQIFGGAPPTSYRTPAQMYGGTAPQPGPPPIVTADSSPYRSAPPPGAGLTPEEQPPSTNLASRYTGAPPAGPAPPGPAPLVTANSTPYRSAPPQGALPTADETRTRERIASEGYASRRYPHMDPAGTAPTPMVAGPGTPLRSAPPPGTGPTPEEIPPSSNLAGRYTGAPPSPATAGPPPAPAPQAAVPAARPSVGAQLWNAINPISAAHSETMPPGGAAPAGAAPAPASGTGAPPAFVPPPPPATPNQKTAMNSAPATTALPATSSTPVAPQQQGPSQQSEPQTQFVRPPFDQGPYQAMMKASPEFGDKLTKIANDNGITPARLAWHLWKESRGNPDAPRGRDGEIGPMQIMPSTWDTIDPQHNLNPSKMDDALRLGAYLIHQGDKSYGQDAPLSFAFYQGGQGSADAIQAGHGDAHPQTVAYMQEPFGQTKLGPQNFAPRIQIDPTQLVRAGTQNGPDGVINYLAQSNPGVPMGDKWRAAEGAMMSFAAMRGDYEGMQHARDFVLQMSQQGASTSLMNAYKALQAGDGVTASQQLARAHAFFPDSTMGRFGLDKAGNVWGERLDEHDPSKVLGAPFKITADSIKPMLIQTTDPNKYVQMVTEQQKAAAQARFMELHGEYYGDQIDARREASKESADARRYAADARFAGQIATHGGALDPGKVDRIDTETSKDGPINEIADPQQRRVASMVYSDLRHNGTPGMMTPQGASDIATGVTSGRYQVQHGANGQLGVIDPKTKQTIAVLSQHLMSVLKPMGGAATAGPQVRPQTQAALPTAPQTSSAVPAG